VSEQAVVASPEIATTLLEIQALNAFYGSAQALEDVTFSMGRESIAIVGRNGMGKTTLCNAIMGISPPRASGSIRFDGGELVGVQSHKIARWGLGYVPQGRRLFPSLTVDEHLRIASRGASSNGSSKWTRERVYDSSHCGAEEERWCAALGRRAADRHRAGTSRIRLLYDEPSEGLAPTVTKFSSRRFGSLRMRA
jgi:branched-chain amino acid transport system ATP-binding protein